MAKQWQVDINTRPFDSASGVTITKFLLVGINSSSELVIASSDSGDQIDAIGVALEANNKLATRIGVAKQTVVQNSVWSFTPGDVIYLGSDGAPTSTAPSGAGTLVQVIGKAETATRVRFDVQDDYTTNS